MQLQSSQVECQTHSLDLKELKQMSGYLCVPSSVQPVSQSALILMFQESFSYPFVACLYPHLN